VIAPRDSAKLLWKVRLFPLPPPPR
jgi:hypothetical protein